MSADVLVGVYPTMSLPPLTGRRPPRAFPFDRPSLRLTHLGRGAVWLALRALGLGPGSRLAMPSYHCGSEVEAARLAGVDVVFYRVDGALRVDEGDLARVAGDWSAQMARTGNFSHRDLGAAGGLPGMSKFSALGENIAWVEGYPSMGNQLHVGWMRSEGHRANMLQRGFDSVGIGVVCSGGRAWATQNFGRLDSSRAPSMGSSTPAEEPIVATRDDGVRC